MFFRFPFSKQLENKKINGGLRKPLSRVELRLRDRNEREW